MHSRKEETGEIKEHDEQKRILTYDTGKTVCIQGVIWFRGVISMVSYKLRSPLGCSSESLEGSLWVESIRPKAQGPEALL